jgi:hypothetical protein
MFYWIKFKKMKYTANQKGLLDSSFTGGNQ